LTLHLIMYKIKIVAFFAALKFKLTYCYHIRTLNESGTIEKWVTLTD
jgi:hypothetical protein